MSIYVYVMVKISLDIKQKFSLFVVLMSFVFCVQWKKVLLIWNSAAQIMETKTNRHIYFSQSLLPLYFFFFFPAFAIFSLLAAQWFSIITIVTLEWTHYIKFNINKRKWHTYLNLGMSHLKWMLTTTNCPPVQQCHAYSTENKTRSFSRAVVLLWICACFNYT